MLSWTNPGSNTPQKKAAMLPLASHLTNHSRRKRHARHCWKSRNELISDVLSWSPAHGHVSVVSSVKIYIISVRIWDTTQRFMYVLCMCVWIQLFLSLYIYSFGTLCSARYYTNSTKNYQLWSIVQMFYLNICIFKKTLIIFGHIYTYILMAFKKMWYYYKDSSRSVTEYIYIYIHIYIQID